MAQVLNSCLYECAVFHARKTPQTHAFKNRMFWFALDLDELPAIDRQFGAISLSPWGLYSFCDQDFLPTGAPGDLKRRAIHQFQQMGVTQPIATVLFVGQLRALGYGFNPISLFYALNDQRQAIAALVQVENTFREIKLFPLTPSVSQPGSFEGYLPKHFYVSPFSDLEASFRFQISAPGETLQVRADSAHGDQAIVQAGLTGTFLPLTTSNLLKMSLRYPLITWQMIGGIHFHAFLLFCKRVPFHDKDDALQLQINVLRARPPLTSPAVPGGALPELIPSPATKSYSSQSYAEYYAEPSESRGPL